MNVRVVADAELLANDAAAFIAEESRLAIAARNRFTLALSGGRSPVRLFEALAKQENIAWEDVHVLQVDERAVPAASPDRNFRAIRKHLLDQVPIPESHVHPMPAEAGDLTAAAEAYAMTLARILGPGKTLDLVHLGLGSDGHTASLLPGDPALSSVGDVVVSHEYQGARRLSLSLPAICRARQRVWFITGRAKSAMVKRAMAGDAAIPAGRVTRENSTFFIDREAAERL